MSRNALTALVVVAATSMAGVAAAEEVEFSRASTAPGYALATQLFSEEIAQHRGVSLETAVIDLEGDGVGELAVRLNGFSTCDADRCLTLIARYDEASDSWEEVFRERVRQISLEEASGEDRKRIVVDEDNVFTWSGDGYARSAEASGYTMVWEQSDDPAVYAALRRDVRGLEGLDEIRHYKGYADVNGDGEDEIWVYVLGGGFCGAAVGCPVLGYSSLDSGPFFRGSGFERVELTNSERNGLRQVILYTQFGERVNYWNGNSWTVAD